MEYIRFIKFNSIDDFLKKEGEIGGLIDQTITDFQGSIFENLVKAKTLKQVHQNPKIFSLRIPYKKNRFRFFGPKLNSDIYLVWAIKKKTAKIAPREMDQAIKITKAFLQNIEKSR